MSNKDTRLRMARFQMTGWVTVRSETMDSEAKGEMYKKLRAFVDENKYWLSLDDSKGITLGQLFRVPGTEIRDPEPPVYLERNNPPLNSLTIGRSTVKITAFIPGYQDTLAIVENTHIDGAGAWDYKATVRCVHDGATHILGPASFCLVTQQQEGP